MVRPRRSPCGKISRLQIFCHHHACLNTMRTDLTLSARILVIRNDILLLKLMDHLPRIQRHNVCDRSHVMPLRPWKSCRRWVPVGDVSLKEDSSGEKNCGHSSSTLSSCSSSA